MVDIVSSHHLSQISTLAITFVCLVISIGLFVDFLLHVLLRYVFLGGVMKLLDDMLF